MRYVLCAVPCWRQPLESAPLLVKALRLEDFKQQQKENRGPPPLHQAGKAAKAAVEPVMPSLVAARQARAELMQQQRLVRTV